MFNPYYAERGYNGRWQVREYVEGHDDDIVMLTASEARAQAMADRLNAEYQAEQRGYRRAKLELPSLNAQFSTGAHAERTV
jgi:hypothetical protein